MQIVRLYETGRYLPLAVLVLSLISVAFAQTDGESNLSSALKTLCYISQTVMGAVVMVLIVLAGATYAIGQIMGAETRARATTYATAMLTGAVIGAIIYLVGPIILTALVNFYPMFGKQFYYSYYGQGDICGAIGGASPG
ncbi:MAG: hypothetical protein PHV13_03815 [Candidatus ainarchaeum sp.]|nr:hypothetical protein [Candidatus ainarchaeum sp.]